MKSGIPKLVLIIVFLITARTTYAEDVISGKFDLLDHNGRAVTEQSYDGKLRLVFFGFTACPDVCPTTLFEVGSALQQLGELAREVQPLFISVDRDNDTQEKLAAYVGAFHPSIIGLTGSEEQLAAAAKSFNVTYGVQAAAGGDGEEVFHSAYLFLMDRQGRFVDVFGYGTKAGVISQTIQGQIAHEKS